MSISDEAALKLALEVADRLDRIADGRIERTIYADAADCLRAQHRALHAANERAEKAERERDAHECPAPERYSEALAEVACARDAMRRERDTLRAQVAQLRSALRDAAPSGDGENDAASGATRGEDGPAQEPKQKPESQRGVQTVGAKAQAATPSLPGAALTREQALLELATERTRLLRELRDAIPSEPTAPDYRAEAMAWRAFDDEHRAGHYNDDKDAEVRRIRAANEFIEAKKADRAPE